MERYTAVIKTGRQSRITGVGNTKKKKKEVDYLIFLLDSGVQKKIKVLFLILDRRYPLVQVVIVYDII